MTFLVDAAFENRTDAGRHLAARLAGKVEQPVAVLGLARGGVIVAAQVARAMQAPLDVLAVRKLGSPLSGELAVGAVTANGGIYLNEEVIQSQSVSKRYIDAEVGRQRLAAREREALYRQGRPPADLQGKNVILVDDGMATGSTMIAAVRSAHIHEADSIVVAVPVAAPESCDALRVEADDVVCLYGPSPFWSVGLYYQDFSEVADEEVLHALAQQAED